MANEKKGLSGETLYKIFIYVVLITLAVIIIVPVAWVFLASIKQNSEFYGNPWALPASFYWQNFVDAWNAASMGSYMLNSVLVTALSLALLLVIALPAAYCLARFRFRGGRFLNTCFMAGLFINVNYIVVPIFLMLRDGDLWLKNLVGNGFLLNNLVVLPLLSKLSDIVIFRFHTYGVDWLWWFISLCDKVVPFRGGLLLTGMALALAGFRHGSGEERRQPLPKGVVPLLALLLAGMVFEWVIAWVTLAMIWPGMPSEIVISLPLAMTLDMFSMGIVGIFALVKARMADRRWRAVYILALTGSILGLSIFSLWTRMDVLFSDTGWQTPILLRYIAITTLGLVGMGGCLC